MYANWQRTFICTIVQLLRCVPNLATTLTLNTHTSVVSSWVGLNENIERWYLTGNEAAIAKGRHSEGPP